jgi:hypothetical protein
MSTESTERPTGGRRAAQAANLFDLRRIIGGLFTIWGVLLIILGATDSTAEANKAAGLNINLIAGIGMLVFGILFLIWAFSRPLGTALVEAEDGEHPGRAAPRGVDAAALGASDQSRGGTRRDRNRSGGQGGAGT